MSIAISKKFPGSDLAIQQISPTWTVSYRISKHLEICNGTLSYRTVANDLRREVNLMRPALSRRAAKGSFRATYGMPMTLRVTQNLALEGCQLRRTAEIKIRTKAWRITRAAHLREF